MYSDTNNYINHFWNHKNHAWNDIKHNFPEKTEFDYKKWHYSIFHEFEYKTDSICDFYWFKPEICHASDQC